MRELRDIADEVQRCAAAWDADACLIGNVTAAEIMALAAAPRVLVLDQFTVVTKDGEAVMDYTRRKETAEGWVTIFDAHREDCAPHRVVRVALVDTQEGTNDA